MNKKQPETQNKLANQWMTEDSRVKTKKSSWKVKKSEEREDVQIKKLIAAPFEEI